MSSRHNLVQSGGEPLQKHLNGFLELETGTFMPLLMTLFFEIQNPLWPVKSTIIMMHGNFLNGFKKKFFVS